MADKLTHHEEIDRIERLANLMDSRFRVFGIRIGLDALLGLIPGLGDTATFAPTAWMIWRAHKLGAEPEVLGKMALNAGLDWLIGLVPLLGDILDIGFRANTRNAKLLRRHFDEKQSDMAQGLVGVALRR